MATPLQAAIAPRGDARTWLTHFVGGGLDDDHYVVERFHSLANGDIVPVHADGTKLKGRRKARGTIVSLKAVEQMRPARDENQHVLHRDRRAVLRDAARARTRPGLPSRHRGASLPRR